MTSFMSFYEFLKRNLLWFAKHVSVKEKINPADIAKKQKKTKENKKPIFFIDYFRKFKLDLTVYI